MSGVEFEANTTTPVRIFRTRIFAGPGSLKPEEARQWLYVTVTDLVNALRVGIRADCEKTRQAVDYMLGDVAECIHAASYAAHKGVEVSIVPEFAPGERESIDYPEALRDLALVTRIPIECWGEGGTGLCTLALLSKFSDLLLEHIQALGGRDEEEDPEEEEPEEDAA